SASPFLTFAVAVHRVAERLARASYVDEWIGPRQRVPVFAVEPLRQLLADPLRRFFFVELLTSYTHVVSGSTWTATPRGRRPRRGRAVQRARPGATGGPARDGPAQRAARRAAPARRPRPVPDRRVPRSHGGHIARPLAGRAAAVARGRRRAGARRARFDAAVR